jgi:hypothetical protein
MPLKFTRNKQVVRDLQCDLIRRAFEQRLGHLKYFGLSSPDMKDVRDWAPLFAEFHVVERGQEGKEWLDQHDLLVTAALTGLSGKTRLLRGDIDTIALVGKDTCGVPVAYPFDVISLDYSGGLFYRTAGEIPRLKAIERVIEEQGKRQREWLLFVSLRLDQPFNGEVKRTLENIRTELRRYGANADVVVQAILVHPREQIRLKVYVPYFVNQVASGARLRSQTEKPVMYMGNNRAPMMNFMFRLRPDARTVAPRFPQERLSQIINSPLREIKSGKINEVTLGLPKLLAPNGAPDPGTQQP